ncbi:MAG: DedA family protein, partial [Deltaproteobacteria bacterium]|nr:DedA family protein [Deltaproteobacteria bacterium]
PIPPDALLIALCLINPKAAFIYAFICALGSVLGGIIGYFIGLKGGRPLLKRWFKSEKISLVENYYQKWDVWAVGIAGFTPIPYKIFTISAGVFDLNVRGPFLFLW